MPRRRRNALAIIGVAALVTAVTVLEVAYRAPQSDYADAIRDARPSGYWRLGQISGSKATNLVDAERAGKYVGAVGHGVRGAIASDLDAAIQLNDRGGGAILGKAHTGARASSIALWIRPDLGAISSARALAFRPPPDGLQAVLPWRVASESTGAHRWTMTFSVPNRLNVFYRSTAGDHPFRISARLNTKRFSFIVLTLSGAHAQLWVNGNRSSGPPAQTAGLRLRPASPLTIGGPHRAGVKPFVGTVDDIATFSRVLQAREIRRLWQASGA